MREFRHISVGRALIFIISNQLAVRTVPNPDSDYECLHNNLIRHLHMLVAELRAAYSLEPIGQDVSYMSWLLLYF